MFSGVRRRIGTANLYYGWIIAVACFSILLAVFSIAFSFGVFFDFLISDLGSLRAETSLVFSIQIFMMYSSAAVAGFALDRYTVRRMVLLGLVLIGAGMFAAIRADTLVELYLFYGVVAGTGFGMVYVIGYSLPARWFDERRGIATAIATSGTGIATLLAPVAASWSIDLYGWQTTYGLLTIGALAILALVAMVLADSPGSLGIDAATEFPDGLPDRATDRSVTEQLGETATVVRSASFLSILFAWVVIYVPVFTVLSYLVTYTTDVGLARWVGVWALSILGGMTIPGRLVTGVVADRVGRIRSYALITGCLGLAILALPFVGDPLAMFAFAAVYGLLYGGSGALVAPLIADFYGSERVTTLYGISAPAFGVAAIAGPYLAGKTFEWGGDYTPFFVGCAILSLLGTVGLVVAARRDDVL